MYNCKSIGAEEKLIGKLTVGTNINVGLYTWLFVLSSCSAALLIELADIDLLIGLPVLNLSISFSPDIRNLSNDLPWNLHDCVIPSITKYWGATDLKKNPDIFLYGGPLCQDRKIG